MDAEIWMTGRPLARCPFFARCLVVIGVGFFSGLPRRIIKNINTMEEYQ
jgi:hypothetical protein